MRGFGAVQTCFAAEAQMDKLAAALELDPVDLRLRNALAPGDVLPTGQRVTGSLPVAEVIRLRGAAGTEPEPLPRDPLRLPGGSGNTTRGEGIRRGVGFAVGFKNICYSFDDHGCPGEDLRRRGRASGGRGPLRRGGGGPGRRRRHRPGRAHGLGLEDVAVAPHSTATVDSSGSSSASRMTWMAAGAAQLACRAALEELERRGGALEDGEEIDVERIYRHRDGADNRRALASPSRARRCGRWWRWTWALAGASGLDRHGAGRRQGDEPAGGRRPDRGRDRAGLGLALMEEIQTRDGVITNASFTDYLIPTALDMPPVRIELVEEAEPDAPYGRGEPPTVVSTAAIVSALRAASGRDLRRVPVRPDDLAGL